MKKFIVLLIALTMIFAFTACGSTGEQESGSGENMQIPNPFIDCSTLDEAVKIAGFDVAVPERIDGYPDTLIQAIENEMVQVYYYEGSLEDEGHKEVLVRKAVGSDDITGDYNEYSENETMSMHGVDVTLRGEDGKVMAASWTQDGYSYAIDSSEGLASEEIEGLVEIIK